MIRNQIFKTVLVVIRCRRVYCLVCKSRTIYLRTLRNNTCVCIVVGKRWREKKKERTCNDKNCLSYLTRVLLIFQNRGKMPRGKGTDAKPRGRMTAYAFFVQTCREEHKKKHPDENVIFAEFSKKCAERWKVSVAHDYYYIIRNL